MTKTRRDISAQQLEALRQQQPFGRLLIRAHRAFLTATTAKLEALGYAGLGGTPGVVLAQLDPEGTRLTTIAERLGITKQSVSQIVNDLEQRGYVQRFEDPTDRRANLVRFTPQGWQFCQDANRVRLELEAEYETALGLERMQTLRDLLERLLERAATS